MSTSGLDVFDTTLQKTDTWLKDRMQELGCAERDEACHAMRAARQPAREANLKGGRVNGTTPIRSHAP